MCCIFWREFAATSPDELVYAGRILPSPGWDAGLRHRRLLLWGDSRRRKRFLKPLRTFAKPIADAVAPMSYTQLQGMFEPFFPPGRQVYTKSNFIRNLSDEAVDTIVQYVAKSPSPYTFCALSRTLARSRNPRPGGRHRFPLTGSIPGTHLSGRCGKTRRTRKSTCGGPVSVTTPCDHSSLAAHMGITSLMRARRSPVKHTVPNYDRLVTLKTKYDPTNFFHMNHNIQPATAIFA